MGRSKGITLTGDAAKAFVESAAGREVEDEADAYVRLATRIHVEVAGGNMKGAVALLVGVHKLGPMKMANGIRGL